MKKAVILSTLIVAVLALAACTYMASTKKEPPEPTPSSSSTPDPIPSSSIPDPTPSEPSSSSTPEPSPSSSTLEPASSSEESSQPSTPQKQNDTPPQPSTTPNAGSQGGVNMSSEEMQKILDETGGQIGTGRASENGTIDGFDSRDEATGAVIGSGGQGSGRNNFTSEENKEILDATGGSTDSERGEANGELGGTNDDSALGVIIH